MDTTATKTRWANAFIYALVTTVMVLSVASILASVAGKAQQELAGRVDGNTKVAVTASNAIICILQLGVSPHDPPRSTENVQKCLQESGYLDAVSNRPTVIPSEGG